MQRRSCHVLAARPIASIGPAPAKGLSGRCKSETATPRTRFGKTSAVSVVLGPQKPRNPKLQARPNIRSHRLVGAYIPRRERLWGATPGKRCRLGHQRRRVAYRILRGICAVAVRYYRAAAGNGILHARFPDDTDRHGRGKSGLSSPSTSAGSSTRSPSERLRAAVRLSGSEGVKPSHLRPS